MRQLLPLLFLLAGCPKEPISAPSDAASAVVASVMSPMQDEPSTDVPERVQRVVRDALAERGHAARFEPPAGLNSARSSEQRLTLVQDNAQGSDLIVLIEAAPVFTTQMAGRFRWQVDVDLTLAWPDRPDSARTWSWQIPVFLLYHHQREAEAFDEAAPMLQRKLDLALDEYVGTGSP